MCAIYSQRYQFAVSFEKADSLVQTVLPHSSTMAFATRSFLKSNSNFLNILKKVYDVFSQTNVTIDPFGQFRQSVYIISKFLLVLT